MKLATLPRWMERVSPTRGSAWAFGWYLLTGTAIFLFLFLSIHRRDSEEIQKNAPDRYRKVIVTWIEHGYLRHGGLAFHDSVDANPTQKVWRSSSMIFLQGAHVLERIHYRLTGRYSDRLMALHNQLIVLIAAALVGLLGMRLASRMGIPPAHAFILGLSCQVVYQTFPHNLWYFWEIYPTAVVSLVAIAWLMSEEARFGRDVVDRRFDLFRAAAIFLLVWVEPYGTSLFIATYVLIVYLYAPSDLKTLKPLATIVAPALAAVALFAAQMAVVKILYPRVVLEGSGFLFRTGLDGSTKYVNGHWDLLTRRWPQPGWPINHWKTLFLSGAIAVVIVTILYLTKLPALRSAVFVISVALGLYLPFAFSFSQAVAIHPYGYDVYLALPLIVSLFAILPAALERMSASTGVLILASLLTAFCFACVQLRAYAIQFPLTH